MSMRTLFGILMLAAAPLSAQSICEDQSYPMPRDIVPPPPVVRPDASAERILKYAALEAKHRLIGLASYYSTSLEGTLTANGERYHNKRLSAAHLTLPLGCWVEVKSVATGKKVRLRVNDRGPYVKKFMIDLSQAAARAIGVDVAEDRTVLVRIIALPGEDPLPADTLEPVGPTYAEDGGK